MNPWIALFPLVIVLSMPPPTPFSSPRAAREEGSEVRGHVLLHSEHPLLQSEREQLQRIGCRVVRELGARQYIVRINPDARERVESQLFVAGTEALPTQWRVHASARQEAARFGPQARLNVLFHDDVSFEQARRAIARAGGWLESPLELDFRIPRRLEVAIPDTNLDALAEQDEILQIHGPTRPIKSMNASAAAMSTVPPVHSAPYDLSGAGVIVSVFDLGNGPALADASHPEFEGRVIPHGSLSVADHPTHVTGTIAAKGINPQAKGMAPATRVENFPADGRTFLDDKDDNFTTLSIRADNNSWGLVHGWSNKGDGQWEWYGDDEDCLVMPSALHCAEDLSFGAYGFTTSGLDQIVREHQTLIVYSAGNDNNDIGPSGAPFEHSHVDQTLKYCFSQNGSGTDCLTPCERCEITRHKRDGPWGTMNLAGSGKNTIAVGAVSSTRTLLSFSSRGPSRDGRIKPDLVARGSGVFSTLPSNNYGVFSGTSMSAPVVTGITALLVEQWRRTFNGANPTPEALRVLLIQGAEDLFLAPPGEVRQLPGPDYAYGYGLANAKNSVDTIIADGAAGTRIKSGSVTQGTTIEYLLELTAEASAKLTLGWSDPENLPFPAKALINDLDLKVIAPDSSSILPYVLNPADPGAPATRGVNDRDNVEQIVIENAAAGTYRIHVIGTAIATAEPQTFVLASSSTLGPSLVCVDVFEPNDSIDTAFGRLGSGTSITGKACRADDVDFYRFVVNRSGPVSVAVTATDTPVRVTLLANGALVGSAEVPVGSTRTVPTNAGTGIDQPITPITYSVRIEPTGTIGSNASYTLTPTFRFAPAERTRAARR